MQGIFLDIETTGLDPRQHHPIDLALKVVDLATGETLGSYQSVLRLPREVWDAADPSSIEVNGYRWDQIEQGKDPVIVGNEVIQLFQLLNISRGRSVFICQNPGFDRAFFSQIVPAYTQEGLLWPYHWLDLASMFWAKRVLAMKDLKREMPKEINLSKNSIAQIYHIPPEKRPHKAMNGVDHLILCYAAVLGADW